MQRGVGVHLQDRVVPGEPRKELREDLVERTGLAVTVADRLDDLDALVGEGPSHLHGPVSGVVGDDDDPVRAIGLPQDREDRDSEVSLFVVSGDEDNDAHSGTLLPKQRSFV
jgi:hypothetical protein